MKKETWKEIDSTSNKYQVSNLGRIRNSTSLKLRKVITKKGYGSVTYWLDGKYKQIRIHREVALAFIPNQLNKPQVNHINGKKLDNRVKNLEWVTAQENVVHSHLTGLKKPLRGNECSWSKLTSCNVKEIRSMLKEGVTQKALAQKFNVSRSCISLIKRKINWANS